METAGVPSFLFFWLSIKFVEHMGLEPTTFWLRTKRSTRWANAPLCLLGSDKQPVNYLSLLQRRCKYTILTKTVTENREILKIFGFAAYTVVPRQSHARNRHGFALGFHYICWLRQRYRMRLGKAMQETGLALLSAFTIFVIQKTGDWEVWEM